jgi:hypothetical protein
MISRQDFIAIDYHGDANPDYTTLGMNPNTITAPVLDNLIQDTLHLIDNQW